MTDTYELFFEPTGKIISRHKKFIRAHQKMSSLPSSIFIKTKLLKNGIPLNKSDYWK